MKLLSKAIHIATEAHDGQVDKQGNDYILHPLAVMMNFRDEESQIVAVLHDVLEDCDPIYGKKIRASFPTRIVVALYAITRQEGEEYTDYIRRVSRNSLAKSVKLKDLQHNLSRIHQLAKTDPEVAESLYERYMNAIAQIKASEYLKPD